MKFFNRIPTMECLAGDTLPTFTIPVTDDHGDPFDISGWFMTVVIADVKNPETAVVTKQCTPIDGVFTVQLTNEDTQELNGTYMIHFGMANTSNEIYRKLAGILKVHPAAAH